MDVTDLRNRFRANGTPEPMPVPTHEELYGFTEPSPEPTDGGASEGAQNLQAILDSIIKTAGMLALDIGFAQEILTPADVVVVMLEASKGHDAFMKAVNNLSKNNTDLAGQNMRLLEENRALRASGAASPAPASYPTGTAATISGPIHVTGRHPKWTGGTGNEVEVHSSGFRFIFVDWKRKLSEGECVKVTGTVKQAEGDARYLSNQRWSRV